MGNFNQDLSLTSEERRYFSFKNGNLPLQPILSINSVICSESGLLSEAILDENGNYSGNYILVKDLNPDTGGSPFGLDKIKFVGSEKSVSREVITKFKNNSSDSLQFSNIDDISSVYQEIQIISENSSVSKVDNSIIKLNHKPISQINKIVNFTTGEAYTIDNSYISPDTGLNLSGEVKIKGKTLPSLSDKLKVDYVWRRNFISDKEYLNKKSYNYFQKRQDSIDWSINNGISEEESELIRSSNNQNYQLKTTRPISSIDSVYYLTEITKTIDVDDSGKFVDLGISNEITNIDSIILDNVDIYNTLLSNGYISGKKIYLPTDSGAEVGSSAKNFV